jgi:colanic acid/amylovoran biosynthesis glycosyltransferase
MEGQALVLQEAQAMGLPVISTLHNGIPEGVLDGKSGLLVQEKSVDALVAAIEYLIDHPELWPAMGKNGREFVEARYDSKILNKKLMDLYISLLSSTG